MSTDDDTTEPTHARPAAEHPPVRHYEIRVHGHLGTRWAASFDGMTLTDEDDGTTAISGPVADQSALHGVLEKLRDLGISLRSLTQIASDPETGDPSDHPHPNAPGAAS